MKAKEVAKDICKELNFEDASVGIFAVGQLNECVLEEIAELYEGIEIVRHDRESMVIRVNGEEVGLRLVVFEIRLPIENGIYDHYTEWMVEEEAVVPVRKPMLRHPFYSYSLQAGA